MQSMRSTHQSGREENSSHENSVQIDKLNSLNISIIKQVNNLPLAENPVIRHPEESHSESIFLPPMISQIIEQPAEV